MLSLFPKTKRSKTKRKNAKSAAKTRVKKSNKRHTMRKNMKGGYKERAYMVGG